MKTKAVRLYGVEDLRLEEFELPEITDDEILALVMTDSLCLSSYKAAKLATEHKRVPADIATNPIIIGHEFCGEIVKVGARWSHKFKPGQKFTIQPAMNYKGSLAAAGYSFPHIGGDATYVIVPVEVMLTDCLFVYEGTNFFGGSLAEPLSCVAGAFHAMYHTIQGKYEHYMGIKEGGKMALLAAAGPMGLAAIDYILGCDRRPSKLIVTDIDDARLARAAQILSPEYAATKGVELKYLNTAKCADAEAELMQFTDGTGYDDVVVFAAVTPVVEQADHILGADGCLNFFAGPADTQFAAKMNFFNVHYSRTHVCGTTGGNGDDMKEVIKMVGEGKLNPAILVTHIGGLNCVPETTLNLSHIPGGKKLIYTGIELDLTAIADFREKGKTDVRFERLADITEANNGLWCEEAENYLLANFN